MNTESFLEGKSVFTRLSLRDGRGDVQGTVFSYDRRKDWMALLEPEPGSGKYSVRLLNLRNARVAEVLEARPSTDAMPEVVPKKNKKKKNKK